MFYLERQKHSLTISNPAIMVIDVQSYFFHKNSKAYIRGSERVLENIKNFVVQTKRYKIPIIATIHKGGSEQMKKWWGNIVDDEWAELMIENSVIDYIVVKNTYDAFYNTELFELLKLNNIDQLFITGVMTHLCCETTARSGFVNGFDIVMIEDCLWDKDEWYHYASLKNIAHGFGIISTSTEILEKLNSIKVSP
ncbi:MAG: isochorismatase family cysteine hydrolase [Fervidobacterium sp.]